MKTSQYFIFLQEVGNVQNNAPQRALKASKESEDGAVAQAQPKDKENSQGGTGKVWKLSDFDIGKPLGKGRSNLS
jgi:hypothetical protein